MLSEVKRKKCTAESNEVPKEETEAAILKRANVSPHSPFYASRKIPGLGCPPGSGRCFLGLERGPLIREPFLLDVLHVFWGH
jgi:hypothetical protein